MATPSQLFANAAMDRLLHHARIIDIEGESYRNSPSKRRSIEQPRPRNGSGLPNRRGNRLREIGVRQKPPRELGARQERAEARLEEVRAGLHAQLVAAQQVAEERIQARDQIAHQLADLARAEAKRHERAVVKKERPK